MVVKAPQVETPATAEQVADLLRHASAEGQAVVPVGGGRARSMGDPLERCDVELRTTRMDRVLEHSQADMVVSVEAGITVEALQAELAKAGQFLPVDPFNSPGHTIGGLLATGWTGPLRMRYGSPRDFLIGIRVAQPDGKVVAAGGRVVKNVSGYDMMKLHFGALGTLGVIVAASFKVFPRPLDEATVASDGGWEAAERALAGPLAPVALELFSDGAVLARFFGGPRAVKGAVDALGWKAADAAQWERHSRRAPDCWARIAVPRTALRAILESLPSGSSWWASPGAGIAHWSAPADARVIQDVRASVETAGGSLVLLASPDAVMREAGAWGRTPATVGIMRRIKSQFDPQDVLNPGRFVY